MYGTLPSSEAATPSPCRISYYKYLRNNLTIMNTNLLSPEPDPSIEEEEERNDTKAAKDLEQQIECPRCYDVMTLSSNFDSVCHEYDYENGGEYYGP